MIKKIIKVLLRNQTYKIATILSSHSEATKTFIYTSEVHLSLNLKGIKLYK